MNKIYFVLAIAALMLVSACSKKEEKPPVVINNNQEVKEKTPDIYLGKLKEEFPKDIPLYKNAVVLSSSNINGKVQGVFDIQDKGVNVGKYYQIEMPKYGYESVGNNSKMMSDITGDLLFKKDGKTVNVGYSYKSETGKTMLTIDVR